MDKLAQDQDTHSDSANDTVHSRTRRDAKARHLCARLCSERRTIAELDAIDRLLTKIERVEDGLIELRRQTYWPPSQEYPGEYELGGEG